MLLWELEQRSVLEVATERTQATVQALLECLDQLEQIEREGSAGLREVLSAFSWDDEILAIFDFLSIRLSSGFIEGKNKRTKTLMHQAYGGYRNRRTLQLRITRSHFMNFSQFHLEERRPI